MGYTYISHSPKRRNESYDISNDNEIKQIESHTRVSDPSLRPHPRIGSSLRERRKELLRERHRKRLKECPDHGVQDETILVVSGSSGSKWTQWTKQMVQSTLIQPTRQRIIWCYGQWEPLYEEQGRRLPYIEFINAIHDRLNEFIDKITQGQHHRNISIVGNFSDENISVNPRCMKQFEEVVQRPHVYLVVGLKSSTPEHRL